MAKSLEKGSEKIQGIIDLLKKETLEPAKKEAEEIIEEARAEASRIIAQAEKEAKELHQKAHESIEKEKNIFQSALTQAAKQVLESLKQRIASSFFNPQLVELIDSQAKDPQLIAKLLQAVIEALQKEGIEADLSAIIPRTVSPQAINALLGENLLKKLKGKSVVVGEFAGGIQVKLHDKQLTLDITDSSLKELLSAYVQKDFRKLIFTA